MQTEVKGESFYKIVFGCCILFHLIILGLVLNSPDNFGHLDSHRIFKLAGAEFQKGGDWGITILAAALSIPVKFGITYEVLTLFFSFISLAGYYFLYLVVKEETCNNSLSYLSVLLLFLLPSIHYWTCFISKDSVFFFLICGLVFSIKKEKFRLQFLFLALMFIRPHIAIVILIVTLFYHRGYYYYLSTKQKISLLIFVFMLIFCALIFFHFKISPLQNLLEFVTSFGQFNFLRNGLGHSPIRLGETYFYERFLMLMYRPLFFDAKGYTQNLASMENLILLIYTVFILGFYIIRAKRKNNLFITLGVAIWIIISVYIYNLGLANRMKVMILPFIFIGVILYSKSSKPVQ
ncbi:hypothetical protein OKE80_00465 [Riemerella anatipestifer]|uniref:Glycosyltransferase RgtA/B/C/D-like domain-containing protein n=2 Tax=Riemerella anatipestifer TaxID=34085 RepID=E4TA17_RIEAD|nr:hypothetical protein [Riemerella anatipestifer]ADQ81914.1 hypothetical protein Riean_0750 [Riemerella anatipestifer ATCC 11845 = DSM 15868]AFD55920.1 hypothetical protein RA0C_0987 [Riemerella anatipestifer ATCC 11845 = DSM 15868]AIH02772.1 hypothetical protein M949_1605 [Riemerella anatipestifer CH3]AZZ59269.1 hypothetical protein AWB57_09665 [Riemerella anatipestifer]MCO7317928.1 hypothetical protein [Riemerella anatipestifer]